MEIENNMSYLNKNTNQALASITNIRNILKTFKEKIDQSQYQLGLIELLKLRTLNSEIQKETELIKKNHLKSRENLENLILQKENTNYYNQNLILEHKLLSNLECNELNKLNIRKTIDELEKMDKEELNKIKDFIKNELIERKQLEDELTKLKSSINNNKLLIEEKRKFLEFNPKSISKLNEELKFEKIQLSNHELENFLPEYLLIIYHTIKLNLEDIQKNLNCNEKFLTLDINIKGDINDLNSYFQKLEKLEFSNKLNRKCVNEILEKKKHILIHPFSLMMNITLNFNQTQFSFFNSSLEDKIFIEIGFIPFINLIQYKVSCKSNQELNNFNIDFNMTDRKSKIKEFIINTLTLNEFIFSFDLQKILNIRKNNNYKDLISLSENYITLGENEINRDFYLFELIEESKILLKDYFKIFLFKMVTKYRLDLILKFLVKCEIFPTLEKIFNLPFTKSLDFPTFHMEAYKNTSSDYCFHSIRYLNKKLNFMNFQNDSSEGFKVTITSQSGLDINLVIRINQSIYPLPCSLSFELTINIKSVSIGIGKSKHIGKEEVFLHSSQFKEYLRQLFLQNLNSDSFFNADFKKDKFGNFLP